MGGHSSNSNRHEELSSYRRSDSHPRRKRPFLSAEEIPDGRKVSIQVIAASEWTPERASAVLRIQVMNTESNSRQWTTRKWIRRSSLPLCRDFIYANKGAFSIESALGRGYQHFLHAPFRRIARHPNHLKYFRPLKRKKIE